MAETLSKSIEMLRNIDSLIDLGRATAQLKILLAIGRRKATIDEIVKNSKLKRKTVLDALRKLETKDLISRRGGHYVLTDNGMAVYETLLRLASVDYGNRVPIPSNISFKKTLFLEACDELLSALYLLRTLEIIGTSNKPYPLKKLASRIGVSQITLDNHLRRFTSPELPLLRRIYSDLESRHVCYKLTDLGLKFYRSVFPRRSRNFIESLSIILAIAVGVIVLLLLL
ncbi:MAG: hypothetical protein B6U76_06360 [Desulfurococcales archaeon ex4484_217_2]|nr:MAG: hypothetical protein B6U76_06360 [Desulfurococcales archaeon ex4484_217_2]